MRAQDIDSVAGWPPEITISNGIFVATGYGLDIRVWRGRLRVSDGAGRNRREILVHRATGRLRRLVVLGHTGAISLDAIRWLSDIGAGYLQLDADGRVLAAFGPQGTDRPGLRRAQARALDTPTGNDIVRRLLAEKVAGQAETLGDAARLVPVADVAFEAMSEAASRLRVAVTRDDLRLAEAQAAGAYWQAWAPLAPTFARRDLDRIPAHWRRFGGRTSPLTGSPRLAGNPANAILNLLYACLEGEAAIAARVCGLDPGIGLLHADQLNRASLAADLMEPIRPVVDRYVLRLFRERSFAATDFFETRQGVCRVTTPLAKELMTTSREWLAAVGRVAEDVARRLDGPTRSERPIPTPISGAHRSTGRGARTVRVSPRAVPIARSCSWCGGPSTPGRRTCSNDCQASVGAANLPALIEVGTAALRQYRSEGGRPELTNEGRQRIGSRSSATTAGAREWQRTHEWPADLGRFEREILPLLARVPVGELANRTGLSVGYLRRVKGGEVRPHPMWWDLLKGVPS